jgi:hypothetical protein
MRSSSGRMQDYCHCTKAFSGQYGSEFAVNLPGVTNFDHETSPDVAATATVPRRRIWPYIIVGALSLMVGAAGATGVLFATGAGQQAHRYSVSVYLDHDVTATQKSKIESAIQMLKPAGTVNFTTSAQAYTQMQSMAASVQTPLPSSVTPDSLPESYQFETSGSTFDCVPAATLAGVAGVDQIQIVQQSSHGYSAVIHCQNMPPSGIGS